MQAVNVFKFVHRRGNTEHEYRFNIFASGLSLWVEVEEWEIEFRGGNHVKRTGVLPLDLFFTGSPATLSPRFDPMIDFLSVAEGIRESIAHMASRISDVAMKPLIPLDAKAYYLDRGLEIEKFSEGETRISKFVKGRLVLASASGRCACPIERIVTTGCLNISGECVEVPVRKQVE